LNGLVSIKVSLDYTPCSIDHPLIPF